eukprot:TRINITY_DN7330_c0_g1_i1.p1 TRINITY_DN7330_c0_g1~~TRINITY_DN7330_c0_g1_i1.p1  ORF type:complete len:1094 (+),score=231.21 TRINITY_DN7330_c0_g1_i1:99-3380(+)
MQRPVLSRPISLAENGGFNAKKRRSDSENLVNFSNQKVWRHPSARNDDLKRTPFQHHIQKMIPMPDFQVIQSAHILQPLQSSTVLPPETRVTHATNTGEFVFPFPSTNINIGMEWDDTDALFDACDSLVREHQASLAEQQIDLMVQPTEMQFLNQPSVSGPVERNSPPTNVGSPSPVNNLASAQQYQAGSYSPSTQSKTVTFGATPIQYARISPVKSSQLQPQRRVPSNLQVRFEANFNSTEVATGMNMAGGSWPPYSNEPSVEIINSTPAPEKNLPPTPVTPSTESPQRKLTGESPKSSVSPVVELPNHTPMRDSPQQNTDRNWYDGGLPSRIREIYRSERRVERMYEWQFNVLKDEDMIMNGNFLISMPTSGGKTLPAEIKLLQHVLLHDKKVIMILPFVSIVTEKVVSIEKFALASQKIRVEGYYNSFGTIPMSESTNVAICTIEKANSLINRLIEEKKMSKVGLVIVDELHMLDESDRGCILEELLTKIRFTDRNIQIIGMSATVPNLPVVAKWLDANVYEDVFRPVPLTEALKVGNQILNKEGKLVRTLPFPTRKFSYDNKNYDLDGLYELCIETIQDPNLSVLIFCSTKDETVAISQELAAIMAKEHPHLANQKQSEREMTARRLSRENSGSLVEKSVKCGIAYHNADLSTDERDIIEQAYMARDINILVATSTLSAGVNLPARRVIIRGMKMGIEELSVRQYRQECGRAGRAGIDLAGESILMVTKNQQNAALALMNKQLKNLGSALKSKSKSFERLILDFICARTSETVEMVYEFMSYTFLAHLMEPTAFRKSVDETIASLKTKGLIMEDDQKKLTQTNLGVATYNTSFSPDDAILVNNRLKAALKKVILEPDLHLLYLLTPFANLPAKRWEDCARIIKKFSAAEEQILELVGLDRNLITSMQPPDKARQKKAEQLVWAKVLSELIAEMPLKEVSKKYGVQQGPLQQLMTSAQSFASQTVNFCKAMNYTVLEAMLKSFSQRLSFGVKEDVLQLTEIRGVGSTRARMLFKAGYREVRQIATESPENIIKRVDFGLYNPMMTARQIIRNARLLLEKQAEDLRQAASTMMQDLPYFQDESMFQDEGLT